MMTIIKNVTIKNRHFTIVKNAEGWYLAIEDKYITDGKTNTKLNGLQMHANRELNGCLKSLNDCVEMRYMVDECGMTIEEAFEKYYGIA